jgi:AraC family transcriptional regulator of adaptative response / DNA-3-methyladenine glycosylase II
MLALGDSIKDRLGELGVISARSETVYKLARVFSQREVDFDYPLQPEEEIKKLTATRGIGNWTAHYIAMRTMGWTDAFLETDAGVKKALHPYTPRELLRLAEAWRPWRGYAIVNLWNTL